MGAVRRVGRYELFAPIASGGMATVHLGRLVGPAGLSRTVAVKRLHDRYARDRVFVDALLEEARLTARVRHPHVAQTLDVVTAKDDVFLVLEYVHGATLVMLMKICAEANGGGLPPPIACSIVSQALHGLHAAHEAMSETLEPLGIVHRDVSPQNILVGADGTARVIDFGIAKATQHVSGVRGGAPGVRGGAPETQHHDVRGKVRYMAPEQMRGDAVDRRTDVFAAGIVLYELLAGQRYYGDLTAQTIVDEAANRSPKAPGVGSAELGAIVTRALAVAPADRFATAAEMAVAIEECQTIAPPARVGEWVREVAAAILAERAELVAEVERAATVEAGIVSPMRERPSSSRQIASQAATPPEERAEAPKEVSVAADEASTQTRRPPFEGPGPTLTKPFVEAKPFVETIPAPVELPRRGRATSTVWLPRLAALAAFAGVMFVGAFAWNSREKSRGPTASPAAMETPLVAAIAPAPPSIMLPIASVAPSISVTSAVVGPHGARPKPVQR